MSDDHQLPVAEPDRIHSHGSCLMFPRQKEARRKFKTMQAAGNPMPPIVREAEAGAGIGYLVRGSPLVAFDANRMDQTNTADFATGKPWCLIIRDFCDGDRIPLGPVGYDQNSWARIFEHVTAFVIDAGAGEPKVFGGVAELVATGERVLLVQTGASNFDRWEKFLATHRPGAWLGFARLHQDGEFGIASGVGTLGCRSYTGQWQSFDDFGSTHPRRVS